METLTTTDLFQLTVSNSAKESIRKFANIVRVLILAGGAVAFITLLYILIRILYFSPLIKGNSLLQLENAVYIIFSFTYVALFITQLIIYRRLARNLVSAVNNNDESCLNKAFKSLYSFSILAIISFTSSILIGIIEIYVSIKYYHIF